jgi:hypothetical protein
MPAEGNSAIPSRRHNTISHGFPDYLPTGRGAFSVSGGDLLLGEITAAVSGSKPDSQDKMRRSKAPSSTPAASHAALKAA